MRLGTELPSVDETEGEVDFAGQSWRWVATVSQTPVEDLRRIDVRVRRSTDAEDSSLAEVSGFVGAVVMDTPPSGTPWTGVPQGQGDDEEEGGQDARPGQGQQPDGGGTRPRRPSPGSEDE